MSYLQRDTPVSRLARRPYESQLTISRSSLNSAPSLSKTSMASLLRYVCALGAPATAVVPYRNQL